MAEDTALADTVVSYEKQTVDSPNPLARFAHRTRIQKSLAIVDEHLRRGGKFADFGAGTGLLLSEFGKRRPDATLFGIEPFQTPYHPGNITYVPDLESLEAGSLDVISAFEVCEHMYEQEIRDFLTQSRKILAPEGKLIISVPVMYGAAAVPKFLKKETDGFGCRLAATLWANWMPSPAQTMSASLVGRPISRSRTKPPIR